MLRSLKIQQFKSIYHAELNLGRANLFVGPNGAGKSNVLEAIGIVAGAISRGLDPTSLDERGIRLSVPTMFKSSFRKTRLPAAFRLVAEFANGRYECTIRAGVNRPSLEFQAEALYDGDIKVFGRGPNGIVFDRNVVPDIRVRPDFVDASRGLWDVISPIAKISDGMRGDLDEISGFNIYAPQTSIMRGVAVDPRVRTPLGLTGAGLAAAFQEVLQGRDKLGHAEAIDQILSIIWEPGWARSISIGGFDPTIVPANIKSEGRLLYIIDKFMMNNRNRLSAFDASEGTLYLIFVATLLCHAEAPASFALDNVDGTLNSRLVRKLTDAIVAVCSGKSPIARVSQQPKQAFVTSHHPSSLDSFDLYSDDQAVFIAHRDLKATTAVGSTKFDRLLPPEGLSRSDWHDRTGGKNMSTLLLDGVIPDAL